MKYVDGLFGAKWTLEKAAWQINHRNVEWKKWDFPDLRCYCIFMVVFFAALYLQPESHLIFQSNIQNQK